MEKKLRMTPIITTIQVQTPLIQKLIFSSNSSSIVSVYFYYVSFSKYDKFFDVISFCLLLEIL